MHQHFTLARAVFLIAFVITGFTLHGQTIRYVTPNGNGSANGSDWQNAANDVQAMIDASAPGDAVWVAAGTYIPTHRADATTVTSPDNRDNAFVLKTDVKVYGGFSGTETLVEQRNWRSNTTILSGDMGVANTVSDNAYHVVISAAYVGQAELNGFTITGGYADGSGTLTVGGQTFNRNYGGGVYLTASSPALSNLVISGNTSSSSGGGMYVTIATVSPMDHISINNNVASFGGGMFMNASSVTLYNALVTGNHSTSGSGGIFCNNASSSLSLINTTISSNRGYGLYGTSTSSQFIIKNTIIHGNENGMVGGAVTAYNSLIQGVAGTANGNVNGYFYPQFLNAPLYTLSPFTGGDYRLSQCSPAIDTGDSAYLISGVATDAYGNNRVYNGTVDMGAVEWNADVYLPTIRYVKEVATGTGDGSSWDNASSDLQAMIDVPCATQVWVAAGTYKPLRRPDVPGTLTPDDRNNTFVLKSNVEIYGGFSGNETQLEQRNWSTNITRLSGDLGTVGVAEDNTYHVVVSAAPVGNAVLNGFIVEGGNANGSSNIVVNGKTINPKYGGSLYLTGSSPTISHVSFTGSYATTFGGGMYVDASSAPMLNGIRVDNNVAAKGGGIYTTGATLTVYNSIIAGNYSGSGYGGICSYGTDTTLINTTVSGNIGFGVYVELPGNFILKNTIVYWNQTSLGGTQLPILYNSLVQGKHSTVNNNLDGFTEPQFLNAPSYGLAPFGGGDYRLGQCSAAINAGDNSFLSPQTLTDAQGNDRFFNGIADMGAMEWADDIHSPVIRYVKEVASGTGDGSSWENASDNLQAMINSACVEQVWVAAGTYRPDRVVELFGYVPLTSIFKSFLLRNNVKVYGGFTGTETSLDQRNWFTNETILSGDINTLGSADDDVMHVVLSAGAVGQAELNGFTVTKGTTRNLEDTPTITINEQSFNTTDGAGIYTANSSPMLKNLTISGNSSTWNGAALCISAGSVPGLYNLRILNNTGKVISVLSSTLICNNSLIAGNTGPAIHNYVANATTVLNNVTISGNRMTVFYNSDSDNPSTYTVRNSIIYGNGALRESAASERVLSYNSLIQGLSSTANGSIGGTVNPMFVNAPDYTTAPFSGGDYSLQAGSPVIDRGNNAYVTRNMLLDILNNNRFSNTVVDMGAFEYQNQGCNTVPPPATEAQVFCGTATVASLTATGQNLQWYTTAMAGQALATSTPLVSGVYYVSQTINGCQSARTPVNVTANGSAPTGAATQVISVDMPSEATIEDLVVQGEGIRWYASVDAITAGTPLAAGTQLVSGTTYYATQTISGCESAYIAVTVQVVLGTATVENAKLTYYPNPVKEVLHITSSEVIGTVELYTLYGQKIATYTWNATNGMLNMQQLQQGAYMVRLTTESATQSFMVTKGY